MAWLVVMHILKLLALDRLLDIHTYVLFMPVFQAELLSLRCISLQVSAARRKLPLCPTAPCNRSPPEKRL